MTVPESPDGRDMARRLLVPANLGEDTPPADVGLALHDVYARASDNLRRSVGDDGYSALLSRALRRAEPGHPILAEIRRSGDGDITRDGVIGSVATHGVPAVATSLEALLAALIDILNGLIGADMVLNLLEQDSPPSRATDRGQPS